MKGSHRVIVDTARMRYEFVIRRNITIVQGDSATGKTSLVEFLSLYGQRGESSGVRVQSDVPCVVFSGMKGSWKYVLGQLQKSIVFIDEHYVL